MRTLRKSKTVLRKRYPPETLQTMLIAASHVAKSNGWLARNSDVSSAYSRHQSQLQRHRDQGAGGSAQAARFRGWAGNRLHDAGRRSLWNREPGRRRQRGDAAAATDR